MAYVTQGPPPWRHQRDACRFAFNKSGSVWWIGMGGGKTRSAVDYIQNIVEPRIRGNVLIVAPLKPGKVWFKEIPKYYVNTDRINLVNLLVGKITNRAMTLATELKHSENKINIFVLNYDVLAKDEIKTLILKQSWDLVIYDEAHRLRSPSSATSITAKSLRKRAKQVIGLTGTLIGKGIENVYAVARAIEPNAFGTSYANFKDRFCEMKARRDNPQRQYIAGHKNIDEFNRILSTFVFQVGPEVTKKNLPPITDTILPVTLDPKTCKMYAQLEKQFATWLDDEEITAANAMVAQQKLQLLTGGFVKLDNGAVMPVHTEKIDTVADFIYDIDDAEKIVIFATFTAEITALHDAIKKVTGRPVYRLTGHYDELDKWERAKKSAVLITQIQAGAEGLDFTDARLQIYYSLCYDLIMYDQSRDRIHRPGQERPVTYYTVVASDTVDEDIYEALCNKKSVSETVRTKLIRIKERGY